MLGGITASGAVRLSMEPLAGAGHDRERLLHGTEANGHSVRPACNAWILWQAHKARGEVDTFAAGDVKREVLTTSVDVVLTFKCDGLVLLCHTFSLVVDWLWRWWTASRSWASAMAISQRSVDRVSDVSLRTNRRSAWCELRIG